MLGADFQWSRRYPVLQLEHRALMPNLLVCGNRHRAVGRLAYLKDPLDESLCARHEEQHAQLRPDL